MWQYQCRCCLDVKTQETEELRFIGKILQKLTASVVPLILSSRSAVLVCRGRDASLLQAEMVGYDLQVQRAFVLLAFCKEKFNGWHPIMHKWF